MKLYLIQHGKAKSGEEDPDKNLTEEGRKESEGMAKSIAGKVKISRLCCSKKIRAKQTAEIFAKALGVKAEPVDGLFPMDTPEAAISLIGDGVAIIGHLPNLSRIAGKLLAHDEGREVVHFSHSGVLCMENTDGDWHVLWYAVP